MGDTKQALLKLRQSTGAGMVDIQKALTEAGGDENKAADILRTKGLAKALKKQDRETREGLVHAYVHSNGRVGTLVEIACETDFVARNDDFQTFAHEVAMQIAAANPLYLSIEDVPQEVKEKEMQLSREEMETSGKLQGKTEDMVIKILEGKLVKYYADACLLEQSMIKDETVKVSDAIAAITAKVGEKIVIKRFVRFAIGE